MASLTCSPSYVQVGESVSLIGDGFIPGDKVTINESFDDWVVQIPASSGGDFASIDAGVQATGTLTFTGQAVAAETVTIGAKTYTWRASVTTTANEVAIGTDEAHSIANLVAAINGGPGAGTAYGSATTANATVYAFNSDGTHVYLRAITPGTAGNSLATTETMTNASFGAADLAGGAAATGEDYFEWVPTVARTYYFTATDGTNTAELQVKVFTSG